MTSSIGTCIVSASGCTHHSDAIATLIFLFRARVSIRESDLVSAVGAYLKRREVGSHVSRGEFE